MHFCGFSQHSLLYFTLFLSFHLGCSGYNYVWWLALKYHPCVLIYTFHVLTGHNWKKASTIVILVLLVLLATSGGIWLLASVGKLHLISE